MSDSPSAPESMPSWFFPASGGGEERGLNDSGIETFKRKKSLSRETIQNILDARSEAAQEARLPARVTLEIVEIPRLGFPAIDQLYKVVAGCLAYTKERFESKEDREANGSDFLERALERLKGPAIPALRIRDERTTGLVGSDKEWNEPYYRLIRGQGYSKSEGVGGGTYGIGQRAPFAFSPLRTLLYYSRTSESSELFVGKSILCSHLDVERGVPTQNIGWFCRPTANANDWSPIRESEEICEFFRRDAIGTDLYVTGFEEWDFEISATRDVLHNFFGAIDFGLLEVSIGNRLIGQESLQETLGYFVNDAYDHRTERRELKAELDRGIGAALFWARALRDPVNGEPFVTEIDRLGEVQLYVIRDRSAPGRVAYMRSPRTLVFDKSNNALTNYAAVVIVDSSEGNDYLAQLEDPAHERWHHDEPRNWTGEQRREARETLQALNRWVREKLRSLRDMEEEDQQDIPELGDLLPAEDEAGAFDAEGVAANTTEETTDTETAEKIGTTRTATVSRIRSRGQPPTSRSNVGDQSSGGGGTGKKKRRSLKIPRKKKKQKLRGLVPVRFRAFATGPSTYQLAMETSEKASGDLTLRAYGEEGSFGLTISAAADVATGKPIPVKLATLKNIALEPGRTRRINVTIQSQVKLSLGVVD